MFSNVWWQTVTKCKQTPLAFRFLLFYESFRFRWTIFAFSKTHSKHKLSSSDVSVFLHITTGFCGNRVLAWGFFRQFISHLGRRSYFRRFFNESHPRIKLSPCKRCIRPSPNTHYRRFSNYIISKYMFGDAARTPMLGGVHYFMLFSIVSFRSPQAAPQT